MIDDSDNTQGLAGDSEGSAQKPEYFREVVLDAGESAQYSQRRVSKELLEAQQLETELAWQSGVLVFQGESLEQALAKISRYTERELLIVDHSISEVSVGGRFKTDDITALVDSLALGLDIKIEHSEGDRILFSAN